MTDAPAAPDAATAPDDIEAMSFEQALAALEHVVGALEGGQIPLDESISLYERGALLKAHCEKQLAIAEERVQRITTGADGTATGTAPLDAS